jgi:Acetyltransferase (GNAT) domain
VRFEVSFTPAIEVAWRLHRRYWDHGYATEAAQASIEDGFTRLGLKEILALTVLSNIASMRGMERLGMTRAIEFDHPRHQEGNPLRRHILYRLSRATRDWIPARSAGIIIGRPRLSCYSVVGADPDLSLTRIAQLWWHHGRRVVPGRISIALRGISCHRCDANEVAYTGYGFVPRPLGLRRHIHAFGVASIVRARKRTIGETKP